ncbi:MAG: hypothetical protein CM15mP19_00560 [Gammaproteobacteria bacterium]|nr:MAG: hypothetical protein CM15mP19_00560 [Gammaproteobacteria bacterium]
MHQEEVLQTYLAKNNIAEWKKAKQADLLADGDTLTIDGEDHIVDLNPETEVLIYHKPTGQVCSNVPTEKMIVFSATYLRAKRQMDHGGAP